MFIRPVNFTFSIDTITRRLRLSGKTGSYALVDISLILLVILPTVAVYIFTKE